MSFLPIVVEMYLKPLGTEREKWVSPALPCTAGKLGTHSPLSISSQESSLPAHSAPHCSVSRRVRVPLTLSSALKLKTESFSRKPGFPKSLSHLWVSAQISALQVFPNYGWQAGVGSLAPAVSTAYTKFYMAVTSCIGRQDSSWDPWLMVPNAQLPQRHLCSWTDTEF